MTNKYRNKIFYLLLPVILIIGIYGSQTSYEISGYFKPYTVKNSNNILTISIDKSSYKPGQTMYISGKVNHSDEGTKVNIQIVGPDKLTAGNFDTLVDRYGTFVSFYPIPDTASSGKYTLTAYYDGDPHKKQISLSTNISNIQNGISYILIPQGAASQDSKLNFDPPAVNVTQGSKIVFVNNDDTLHTIIGGNVKDDGTLSLDDRFKGGYVTPGDRFVISPAPGKYSYFDKLDPWLGGTITVKANPVPTKPLIKSSISTNKTKSIGSIIKTKSITPNIKSKPSIVKSNSTNSKTKANTKSFPVSVNVLATIWKERKDLQKSYPEVVHGNFTNLIKWATSTGWNQDKRLAALIPHGKVPSYLNSVLLTIWAERKDLQKLYPEVDHGNMTNLVKWATTTGWSQEKNLSILTPAGKTA